MLLRYSLLFAPPRKPARPRACRRRHMAKRDSDNKFRARLMAAARRAMKNAHAPYSEFKVGAALLTTKGKMFVGCNVENASYGMTNCAERTAIFTAVAQLG